MAYMQVHPDIKWAIAQGLSPISKCAFNVSTGDRCDIKLTLNDPRDRWKVIDYCIEHDNEYWLRVCAQKSEFILWDWEDDIIHEASIKNSVKVVGLCLEHIMDPFYADRIVTVMSRSALHGCLEMFDLCWNWCLRWWGLTYDELASELKRIADSGTNPSMSARLRAFITDCNRRHKLWLKNKIR